MVVVRCYQAGFTLAELIGVIVIISVLAVVALPRFFSTAPFEERQFIDQARQALRFARQHAITANCATQFQIDASGFGVFQPSQVSDCNSGPFPDPVLLSGDAAADETIRNSNVPDSFAAVPDTSVTFYPQGWACQASGASSARVSLTFTGSTQAATLMIECGTGYVHDG